MSEFYNFGNVQPKSAEKKRRRLDEDTASDTEFRDSEYFNEGFNEDDSYERKTNQKKYKEPSREKKALPKGTLLIGDSIIRLVNPDEFEKEIFLFSYPGITAGELNTEIQNEYLPPPSRIGMVILHVGSNNASTERENQSLEDATKDVKDCMDTLADFYPGAKLWVSGILPRLDKDHMRGKDINRLVNQYCKEFPKEEVQHVDFSIDFIEDSEIKRDLYRYSEGHEDDRVHLSTEGNKILAKLFKQLLEHDANERKGTEVSIDYLSEQDEFDEWRIEHYGDFEDRKRFRVTNWGPAIDRDLRPKSSRWRLKSDKEKVSTKTRKGKRSRKRASGRSPAKKSGIKPGMGYNTGSVPTEPGPSSQESIPTDNYDSDEEKLQIYSRDSDVQEFSDEEMESESSEFIVTDSTSNFGSELPSKEAGTSSAMPSRFRAPNGMRRNINESSACPNRPSRAASSGLMPNRLRAAK